MALAADTPRQYEGPTEVSVQPVDASETIYEGAFLTRAKVGKRGRHDLVEQGVLVREVQIEGARRHAGVPGDGHAGRAGQAVDQLDRSCHCRSFISSGLQCIHLVRIPVQADFAACIDDHAAYVGVGLDGVTRDEEGRR